jgi:tripartite-type tricarboxylate transporter receptor subunit TctC
MTTIGAPSEAALLTRNAGRKREGVVRALLRASALVALGVVVAFEVLPLAANAQGYPTKPIRLVVPFPPGGPNDIIGRVVGQKIQDLLGQLVIIDNRAGAGGVVGADNVAKSEPDGYSIGIASAGALALSAVLLEKMPYDPVRDLALITLLAKVPEVLVASTDLPVKDVAELVALAKAHPGTINYASTGPESMPHLGAQMFRIRAGIDIVHVPYRGAAPAVNDVIGHQVQLMLADVPALLPQIEAGRLRPLAVASAARVPALPNVPTLEELGYPQVEADNWYGMFAPAKTPPAIIAKLHDVTVAALKSPDVHEKLGAQGAILVGGTPAEFAAFVHDEIAKWSKVVQEAGIKIN